MNIQETFKKNRPNLSDTSIKTYCSIIRSVCKKTGLNVDELTSNAEKIIASYKDLKPSSRKTILSALYVLTGNKDFQKQMADDSDASTVITNKQEKTDKQKENWLSQEEIQKVYESLTSTAKMLYKKSSLTNGDLQHLINYILFSVCSGIYIPPRRSLDWCAFKIKNINKDEDNYIEKNEFVFNKYKTAKTHAQQRVAIPKDLKAILNKWIKINPTDWLVFDANLQPLNNVKVNQRFNRIFGGSKGVNSFRHSYLTSKFGYTIDQQNEINETMEDMGSSANMLNTYVKK